MTPSREAYRAQAEELIRAGTALLETPKPQNEVVDEWEARATSVLRELDAELYASVGVKWDEVVYAAIGSAIFGKKDRVRDLIEALKKALEPPPVKTPVGW